jgi:hypothetical protein
MPCVEPPPRPVVAATGIFIAIFTLGLHLFINIYITSS